MWRSFFLALGMTLILLGVQFLFVERMVFAIGRPTETTTQQNGLLLNRASNITAAKNKEFSPPEWAPWGLMASGAVVMLYSFTIPKRVAQ